MQFHNKKETNIQNMIVLFILFQIRRVKMFPEFGFWTDCNSFREFIFFDKYWWLVSQHGRSCNDNLTVVQRLFLNPSYINNFYVVFRTSLANNVFCWMCFKINDFSHRWNKVNKFNSIFFLLLQWHYSPGWPWPPYSIFQSY